MQSERITFLTSPEAKAAITARAAQRGMSTGEYIRLSVENMPEETREERELAVLVAHVNEALPEMQASIDRMTKTLRATHVQVDRTLREAGIRK